MLVFIPYVILCSGSIPRINMSALCNYLIFFVVTSSFERAPVRSSTSTSTEAAQENSLGPTPGHGLMLLRHARAPVTCFRESTGWKTNEERRGCFVCRFCSRRSTGIVLRSPGPCEMLCETAWTRGFNGLYTVVLRIAHTEICPSRCPIQRRRAFSSGAESRRGPSSH